MSSKNTTNPQVGLSGGQATSSQPKISTMFKSSEAKKTADNTVFVEAAEILDSNTGLSWTSQMEDDERSMIAQKSKENEVVLDENQKNTVKTTGRRAIVPRDLSKYPDFPIGGDDKTIKAYWRKQQRTKERQAAKISLTRSTFDVRFKLQQQR